MSHPAGGHRESLGPARIGQAVEIERQPGAAYLIQFCAALLGVVAEQEGEPLGGPPPLVRVREARAHAGHVEPDLAVPGVDPRVEVVRNGSRGLLWLEPMIEVETPLGPVRFKIARRAGQVLNASPEFDDCARIAGERQLPVKQVQAIALKAWMER